MNDNGTTNAEAEELVAVIRGLVIACATRAKAAPNTRMIQRQLIGIRDDLAVSSSKILRCGRFMAACLGLTCQPERPIEDCSIRCCHYDLAN